MTPDARGTPPPAERFLVFDCDGNACVGVLTTPADVNTPLSVGVVIVVGGPQYRVGSHRMFRLLANALAASGVAVLRFDYRGMGDSDGDPRTFEFVDDDLAAAVGALQRETGVTSVVLWGLCDGASAAIMYAARDPRVAGVVAVNPWAHSTGGSASTRITHYYPRRLFSLNFWGKVFGGKIDIRNSSDGLVVALRDRANRKSSMNGVPYLQRLDEGWTRFRKPMLFILSGNDLTAREFEAWVAVDRQRRLLFQGLCSQIRHVPDADHTFSRRAWCAMVIEGTAEWLQRFVEARAQGSG